MDDPIFKINIELRGRGYQLKRAPDGKKIHIMNEDGIYLRKADGIAGAMRAVNKMEEEGWKS